MTLLKCRIVKPRSQKYCNKLSSNFKECYSDVWRRNKHIHMVKQTYIDMVPCVVNILNILANCFKDKDNLEKQHYKLNYEMGKFTEKLVLEHE